MYSIDVAWKSLNKHEEELCGDKVEVLYTKDSVVMILADGMGSGVKANILATLTSKILRTMFQEGASIDLAVETIVKTLPICRERQVAYSTFSILQVSKSGDAYLVEFDNPSCIFLRNNKIQKYLYKERMMAGRRAFPWTRSLLKPPPSQLGRAVWEEPLAGVRGGCGGRRI